MLELDHLIQLLSKLPGLGPRSARRAALFLLKRRESLMEPLALALQETAKKIRPCGICGNLDTADPCAICRDPRRDQGMICIVEDMADLWAIERSASYNGLYHVLGGTLSALDGIGPEDLRIEALVARVEKTKAREAILAMNATVEGQTTAHYILDRLHDTGVKVTRLAHGVPVGGELDYLDEGTLVAAFAARKALKD
ncbi:MAG TPA: recombination mediator RecR [Stellaceae bacterium]|nr:recombination mediator RecR [Stellaceae bacterium]